MELGFHLDLMAQLFDPPSTNSFFLSVVSLYLLFFLPDTRTILSNAILLTNVKIWFYLGCFVLRSRSFTVNLAKKNGRFSLLRRFFTNRSVSVIIAINF